MFFKKKFAIIVLFLFTGITLLPGFSSGTEEESVRELVERTLLKINTFHHPESESLKIRKCEIQLSEDGFFRYRRTYISGKQEYFSFNLSRLVSINYFGNSISGELSVNTLEDDIIVQTFNDRSGDVDSMATYFRLPVHGISAEDLNALQEDLLEIRNRINK